MGCGENGCSTYSTPDAEVSILANPLGWNRIRPVAFTLDFTHVFLNSLLDCGSSGCLCKAQDMELFLGEQVKECLSFTYNAGRVGNGDIE
jgi:hypothetical protein